MSAPQDGDSEGVLQEVSGKLAQQSSKAAIAQIAIPSFKVSSGSWITHSPLCSLPLQTGTLDGLIGLSEEIPKQEAFFTSTVAKTVDTLRNLLNNDPAKLSQHILVNEDSVDNYLLRDWKWNEGRYGVQRGLREMVDALVKVRVYTDRPSQAVTKLWTGNDLHR